MSIYIPESDASEFEGIRVSAECNAPSWRFRLQIAGRTGYNAFSPPNWDTPLNLNQR
ncbi:MAG: hypothetical protein AAF702_40850 [Chloroflexota bacterium]